MNLKLKYFQYITGGLVVKNLLEDLKFDATTDEAHVIETLLLPQAVYDCHEIHKAITRVCLLNK